MAIINNINMKNFEPDEFSENPNEFAHPLLLSNLQKYRNILNEKIFPSKATGSLARFDGSNTSLHYIETDTVLKENILQYENLSKAVDCFCDTEIFHSWSVAVSCGLWGGVGVYFDTKYNDKFCPMLHLDIRDKPLIWYRSQGKYYYPSDKDFYINLKSFLGIYI